MTTTLAGRPSLAFSVLRKANETRHREWWRDPQAKSVEVSAEFRGVELAGEVGEACNVIKKLARERLGLKGSRATKEQLAAELADVIICADLIAMDFGIDLGEAVALKFNETSRKNDLNTRIGPRAEQEDEP
jgi:NTP pyrophosphatase (non-canonical NTP hydrolase)